MDTEQKKKGDVKSDYVIMLFVVGCVSLLVSAYQLLSTIELMHMHTAFSESFMYSIYYFLLAIGIFIAAGVLKLGKRSVVYLLSLLVIVDLIFDFFTGRETYFLTILVGLLFIHRMVTLMKNGELS